VKQTQQIDSNTQYTHHTL